ncbi:hypothetical protein GCM10023085_56260 [Actinomadura viridis]|uniref:Uncharacterized protein n=1 Tax=Actinomadura viridis TaxID=58110 RepID=A0A931DBL8_9ACTN|nr:hypothetical protein [Actinomadura viridis]MBG6085899.1 hypothetical protein [Actinomadura viridis]
MEMSTGRAGGRGSGGPGRRSRVRARAGVLVTGMAAVALLAGACGGSDGDGNDVATNPTASSSPAKGNGGPAKGDPRTAALAYAKCMREKGVPQFPDPDANGGIAIDGSKVPQDSPQFKNANEACKGLLPAPPPGGGGVPEDRAEALKYSKCMRENGVPKFPDPNPGGGLGIDAEKLGVDPNGPVYKEADKKCQKHLGGQPVTQGGGPGAPQGG